MCAKSVRVRKCHVRLDSLGFDNGVFIVCMCYIVVVDHLSPTLR